MATEVRERIAQAYRELKATGLHPTPRHVANALVIGKDWEAANVSNADLLTETVLSMGGRPNG